MTDTQKKTAIAAAVVLVLAILIAVVVYFATGSESFAAGSGAAAAAAVAEAARRRAASKKEVEDSKQDVKDTANKVVRIHQDATDAMKAEGDAVAGMTDDEKVEDGNDLFG
tara:strand:- start:120 stop:452 length:333 start_codon:yes stop_codon:yes gene_type:complete